MDKEKKRFQNYIPHKGTLHRSTKYQGWDDYINSLSYSVSRACDEFFIRRGLNPDSDYTFLGYRKESCIRPDINGALGERSELRGEAKPSEDSE